MAAKIVVDTSVLIKWFKTSGEDLLQEAKQLLEEIERHGVEVHVPALLLYEMGNILLLKTRLGITALDDAIQRLKELRFAVAPPATSLLRRAVRLGRELDLTFYDASFLALAVELRCLCVTAHRRFFERARNLNQVRHLSQVGPIS